MSHSLRDVLDVALQQRVQPMSWRCLEPECADLGLPRPPPVENDSKEKFLRRSLKAVPDADLARVAETFVGRHPFTGTNTESFRVEEALWSSSVRWDVNKRTRRSLAQALSPGDLFTHAEAFLSLLRRLFPMARDGGWSDSLDVAIERHVVRNPGDWSVNDLFEHVGAYDVTEHRFVLLLEGLVSSRVHPDEGEIRALVGKINAVLTTAELREVGEDEGYPLFRLCPRGRTPGRPKNLIFASREKPDIRFRDAVNNDIEILNGADTVLVYDRVISADGLLWRDLQSWYADINLLADPAKAKQALYRRLRECLPKTSPPQRKLFETYYQLLGATTPAMPALIPEVWLHWDPKTVGERGAEALLRFRMDFLLLLPHGVRVVIEVDGKQHYAHHDGMADTTRYADMMASDRDLRLSGYEVYRFGGKELSGDGAEAMVRDFFRRLFDKHKVVPRPP